MNSLHSSIPTRQLSRLSLGQLGEQLAATYLEERGYRLLARNWRDGNRGEIDLIARHRESIVAVEVKTRRGDGYGHPLEAITARKASRLRRLLLAWVRAHRPGVDRLRVDGIGITLGPDGHPRIDHLEGIG